MKIAFVVNSFPSLSETFILNQITGLIDRGHQVHIYSHRRSDLHACHEDVKAYHLMEQHSLLPQPPDNRIGCLIAYGTMIVKLLLHYPGIILYLFRNMFHDGIRNSLARLYTGAAILQKDYDIIHCHYAENGLFASRLKDFGLRSKVLTMFHGYDIRKAASGQTGPLNDLFSHCDCLLSISDYNYNHLMALGADPRKIVHHPVGIDMKRFHIDRTAPVHSVRNRYVILTVARLAKEKGLEYGLQAIKRVRCNTEIEYRIIGQGPMGDSLHNMVSDIGLQDSVYFLGGMTQDQIISEMSRADIFLLPSIEEALPVVLMEAQAMHLPVIATTVGSVAELVKDGVSGYLIPPRDPETMALKIEQLLSDHDLMNRMGENGHAFISHTYNIETLNDSLVALYHSLQKNEPLPAHLREP